MKYKAGNRYMATCLVWPKKKFGTNELSDNLFWFFPVIDHPHNDIENGQKEIHYHIDSRFNWVHSKDLIPHICYDDKYYQRYGQESTRITPPKNSFIKRLPITAIGDVETKTTQTALIAKSNIKHRCIHKGKCPHRGYDLSNEVAKNNVITCPLHGLRFDAITEKILPQNSTRRKF